jgi:hypothetical protein
MHLGRCRLCRWRGSGSRQDPASSPWRSARDLLFLEAAGTGSVEVTLSKTIREFRRTWRHRVNGLVEEETRTSRRRPEALRPRDRRIAKTPLRWRPAGPSPVPPAVRGAGPQVGKRFPRLPPPLAAGPAAAASCRPSGGNEQPSVGAFGGGVHEQQGSRPRGVVWAWSGRT